MPGHVYWFIDHQDVHENIFDKIVFELFRKLKVPNYAYSVQRNKDHYRPKIGNKWKE